jgi:hypothetical protein
MPAPVTDVPASDVSVLAHERKGPDGRKKKFIIGLMALVVVLYGAAISFAVATMIGYRMTDARNHLARMSPSLVEPGHTPPDPLPAQGDFVSIRVGVYVDSIADLSIRNSSWNGEVYVWFNWHGQKDLDPGGKLVLVDGSAVRKQLLDDYHGADGSNYQRYRITAKFEKAFNTVMVPVERPMLNIYLEDGSRDGHTLRYVADDGSQISSRVQVAGYNIVGFATVVKPHTYRSSYGDPRKPGDQHTTFSQYVVGISLEKIGLGIYFKVFLSLYAALALALASFFAKPTTPSRFALPTASYFGVVANSYIVNSILPPSNNFGMVDFVTTIGLGTIFLVVTISLTSNYLYDRKGETHLALTMDRAMFFTVGLCCLVANIAIPLAVIW